MSDLTLLRSLMASCPGAVTVTFGALTTPGLLDFEGRGWGPEGQAQVEVVGISLNFPFPDLPGLEPGSALTVTTRAGVTTPYTVSAGPRQKADGLEASVLLETA